MALGVGKWGAGESYFLSAIVAASVLGGRLASMLAEAGGPLSRLVAVLLLVQCLVSAHGEVSSLIPPLPDRGLQAAALAAEPGSVDRRRGGYEPPPPPPAPAYCGSFGSSMSPSTCTVGKIRFNPLVAEQILDAAQQIAHIPS